MTTFSLADCPEARTKICYRCKREKPFNEFGNEAKKADGKSNYCKTCFSDFRAAWKQRDGNAERERSAIRDWTNKNREYLREIARKAYANNPEREAAKRRRMYDKHRDKRLEYAKQTKLANREFHSQLQRLREAKRQQAFPKWASRKTMNAIYRKARQLEAEDGIKRHVDHIIPLIHPLVSGLHCEFNLQILTRAENMAKKNKFDSRTYSHKLP